MVRRLILPVSAAALLALPALLWTTPLHAQQAPAASPAAPTAPTAPAASGSVVDRIKNEGLDHSQVMQTLSYLTDVIGPRLTGSPGLKRANEWTRDTLTSWGLTNARLEPWGPFGRGWTLKRFSLQVVEPQDIPLIAYPKAWSPGTPGPITAEVVYLDATDETGLEKYKGKLKNKIVLTSPARALEARFEPLAARWSDEALARMAEPGGQGRPRAARAQNGGPQAGGPQAGRPPARAGQRFGNFAFAGQRLAFLQNEGAALLVDPSPRGDGGTLFVQSATVAPPATVAPAPAPAGEAAAGPGGPGGGARRVSAWDDNAKIVPQVVMASEDYNRLVRMAQQGVTLKMAADLQVAYNDNPNGMVYNTVAEIPGTDKKDEIVMLGAHMDSWHSATGATDNAAGVAVCMEAVRILRALNLQPRRTIRIALWTGEEQGLYGSRAYVAEHFGTMTPAARTGSGPASGAGGGPAGGGPGAGLGGGRGGTLTTRPEYNKFAGYFNLDNGTGKIRGVYCQGNEAVLPIFKEWLAPFADMGATTLTIRNTGGTDHQSFDGIGLPGFQFIQDTVEYDTRTHHSNQDNYDRIQADDMKQAAVIMATFVYNTAVRDEMLPRKEMNPVASR